MKKTLRATLTLATLLTAPVLTGVGNAADTIDERITHVGVASGTREISLTWTSNSNTVYAIEQTPRSTGAEWEPEIGSRLARGSSTTAELPRPATNVHGFLRVARDLKATRYRNALESAAIRQSTFGDIADNSLLIGNGDINALLYAGSTGLRLRLTKNDVWDARVNTASDAPLAAIDIAKGSMSGGTDSPASWNFPYPCPLACAVLDLESTASAGWQQIRSEGSLNRWVSTNGLAVMSIRGAAGASCGWQGALSTSLVATNIHVRLSGTSNARYFLEVITDAGQYTGGTGWKTTPTSESDASFSLPPGTRVAHIVVYAWTTDSALAENRYSIIELRGPSGNYAFDLGRVAHSSATNWLDLRNAVAAAPGRTPGSTLAVRALADRNVFLIEGDTDVTLRPTTAPFVPPAQRGTHGPVEYLVQTLPPDPGYPATGDWPGSSFVVARATRGPRTAVAIVTSHESSSALNDAIALVASTLDAAPDAVIQSHESVWSDHWAACRIDLDDTYLRDVWYRNLYFMRCVSKAGVKPVGLFAGLVSDSAAWHGDYHLNYNAEQTYWGWYACNHAELSEPYEWLIRGYLPRARWFAGRTYGCAGAFFPHSVFLYEPPDPASCKSRNGRQVAFIPYTYTLGDAGWAIQNLWLHYKFDPDTARLRSHLYPAIREVALFYAEFADRCRTNSATGRIVFGPTYSPEHWNWGKHDGTCDIAFARVALKAAIESAGVLGEDTALVSRWQQTLEKLPEYPRTAGASPVVLDVAGVSPTTYNVPVPALPVYPAGEVHWFSRSPEKQLFTNTIARIASNGNNDLIILSGARVRLSMPDAWSWTRGRFLARQRPNGTLALNVLGSAFNAYGHYTEQFAASSVIAEMLLQSVNDILRFFPAWPSDKDASFENLRAQGGFLVGADLTAGRIENIRVVSTVGGRLRFLSPWAVEPRARRNGEPVNLTLEDGAIYRVDTVAGDLIELSAMGSHLNS